MTNLAPHSVEPSLEKFDIVERTNDGEQSEITSNSGVSEESQCPESRFLSARSSTCILINFISVGYILNPSGFAQGGFLLAPILLAFVSLQSRVTGTYVLEACARAEALKLSITRREQADVEEQGQREKRHLPPDHQFIVHERTFELSELCRIFLGRWSRNFFTVTTAGDLYGITWTFAAVFGSSLSEHLSMGTDWDYQIYISLFMTFAIPMSCLHIVAQVPLQLCFLVARTVMVFLMMGTMIAAYVANKSHFGEQLRPAQEVPLANFSATVMVLQLCVFSTAFQFSIPGLTAETGNKGGMERIISNAAFYIFVTNLILSLTMALYFGSSTEDNSNLNWVYYHGGSWDGTGEFSRAWWATAISSYIVLFAAIDGLAVYPLIAISLGDILMGAVFEDQVHHVKKDWRIRLLFRLVASIPQAVGSFFLRDLGIIAKYAGVFTLLSYTVCPALLAIKSKRAVEEVDLASKTHYGTSFSSDMVAWVLIGLSVCLIAAVLLEPIFEWSS